MSNHALEGTWKLTSTSGGFFGGGFDADFDYIIIDENLDFTIEENGDVIANGHINEVELDADEQAFVDFRVLLIEDENFINQSISILADNDKYVVLGDDDNMSLNSPCCDRYDFYFEKE